MRDRRVGVLWNGAGTADYAQIVRQWSADVVLFAPVGMITPAQRTELVARAIGVVEGAVSGLVVEDDALTAVSLEDGRRVPRDVVFVPPTFHPHGDLLIGLGCDVDQAGWVSTGQHGATSVPGVWAAGNVVNPRAQVITAAGEGSAAAIAMNADLVAADVRAAVREFTARP